MAVRWVRIFCWCAPTCRVFDNFLYFFVVITRKRLMPRLEIKDLAIATTEGAAAAEDFASWEPANKDQFVWSWDVKVLIFQIRQC